MSHDTADASGLGAGYSVLNVDDTHTTVYHQEAEMGDTALSSIMIIKEVVGESDLSSLSLTPQNALFVDALHDASSVTKLIAA